jgi:LAS superfamily LD-carboxypeptidase LdcB
VARYGDPEVADDWVARPGTSAHERGLAVDLGGDIALAVRLVERLDLPLSRPMAHEPWHFELSP